MAPCVVYLHIFRSMFTIVHWHYMRYTTQGAGSYFQLASVWETFVLSFCATIRLRSLCAAHSGRRYCVLRVLPPPRTCARLLSTRRPRAKCARSVTTLLLRPHAHDHARPRVTTCGRRRNESTTPTFLPCDVRQTRRAVGTRIVLYPIYSVIIQARLEARFCSVKSLLKMFVLLISIYVFIFEVTYCISNIVYTISSTPI